MGRPTRGVEQTTVRRDEGAPGARVETAHCEVSTSGRLPESGGLNSRSDTLRAVTGFQLAAALARLDDPVPAVTQVLAGGCPGRAAHRSRRNDVCRKPGMVH
jgi:hypothetical protein